MRLVPEHIYEKFSENSDPIRDMGIGIFRQRIFDDANTAIEFMLNVLPTILKTDEIPDDIIVSNDRIDYPAWSFNDKYAQTIVKYIARYVNSHANNLEFKTKVVWELVSNLHKKGYPGNVKQNDNIDEKFVEDSDPIVDMGIGLYKSKVNLNSEKEFFQYILWIIPKILETDVIPKDILSKTNNARHRSSISSGYFNEINLYLEEYVSYKGISMALTKCEMFCWNSIVGTFLKKQGY
jgi:hypothetical protein